MNNRALIATSISIVTALLTSLSPISAHAAGGYDIFVTCEHGFGLAGSGPQPNFLCELTWEQTGAFRARYAQWSGKFQYNPNPAIKDEWRSEIFYIPNEPAALLQNWIACSDVGGEFSATVIGTSYERERGSYGYTPVNIKVVHATGAIPNTHPCP